MGKNNNASFYGLIFSYVLLIIVVFIAFYAFAGMFSKNGKQKTMPESPQTYANLLGNRWFWLVLFAVLIAVPLLMLIPARSQTASDLGMANPLKDVVLPGS